MKRKLLSFAAAVLLSHQPLWGGNCPNPPPPLPPLEGPVPIHWNADMCEEDLHWHYVIINRYQIGPFTFGGGAGDKNPYYDQDTGKPCCNKGEIVFNPKLMQGHAAGGIRLSQHE